MNNSEKHRGTLPVKSKHGHLNLVQIFTNKAPVCIISVIGWGSNRLQDLQLLQPSKQTSTLRLRNHTICKHSSGSEEHGPDGGACPLNPLSSGIVQVIGSGWAEGRPRRTIRRQRVERTLRWRARVHYKFLVFCILSQSAQYIIITWSVTVTRWRRVNSRESSVCPWRAAQQMEGCRMSWTENSSCPPPWIENQWKSQEQEQLCPAAATPNEQFHSTYNKAPSHHSSISTRPCELT